MAIDEKFPIIDEVFLLRKRLTAVNEIIGLYGGMDPNDIKSLIIQKHPEPTGDPEREFQMKINSNEPYYMPADMKNLIIQSLQGGFLPQLKTDLEAALSAKLEEL